MSKSLSNDQRNDHELLADAIPIDDSPQASQGQGDAVDRAELEAVELEPIELEPAPDTEAQGDGDGDSEETASHRAIRTFGGDRRHEEHWNRSPNTPGTGAIHVKTFVCKLRLDAVEHMDEQINQWLDSHPQYEVKFVTKSIGTLKGKTNEEALFLSVWV